MAVVARRSPVPPLLLVGAAVLLVPIGVGLLPHLAKTGLGPTSVLAVVLALGGLAALVAGLVGLFRSLQWWAAVPAALGAVVLVALSLWTLGQAVAATDVPGTDVAAATPADHGMAYEDVSFPAADGVELSGWYVPSANGAAVALLHGAGSTRSDVLDQAEVLARHGYGVLLYDARGHGDSEGTAMDFGWYGDADVAGAVAFLSSRPDVEPDRIGAVGLSMGGEQAVGALAAVPELRAVVAEGATQRTAEDSDWLSDVYGLRGALTEGVDAVTYWLTELMTPASPPTALHDAVVASGRSVLLVAAGDEPSEQDAAAFVQRAAPDSVEVWIVPGAGHTGGLATEPEEWEARVTGFLDAHLGVGS